MATLLLLLTTPLIPALAAAIGLPLWAALLIALPVYTVAFDRTQPF
jgi:hypothetical protein